MAAEFNVEARWPELFDELTPDDRRHVLNALASNWHEGWKPNREDVENLTDYARGAIDRAEYSRRVDMAAARDKAHRTAG
ncbi:antitoxin VbhA family protein [Arthrobacter monumenti]